MVLCLTVPQNKDSKTQNCPVSPVLQTKSDIINMFMYFITDSIHSIYIGYIINIVKQNQLIN